jgi:ribonuclease HI
MNAAGPHFLLYSESAPATDAEDRGSRACTRDGWRFILQAVDGSDWLEAADVEPDVQGERAELLAFVRGLEALDQPSRVTLVTSSRYVRLGLAYGLDEWRASGWTWERFGQIVPVKNFDLWQRVDRALRFHTVECRTWRIDAAHAGQSPRLPVSLRESPDSSSADRPGWRNRLRRAWQRCRRPLELAAAQ